ncbi:MAG: cysteine desulfurase family protein [Bacteroidia bacterium]|nr:cysteine desulfurase [Bacteroidia bacterium]MDW8158834.1 cysteine desulfurase family protein [Bacteroidia bacterium]
MQVYFDNAASTPLCPQALEVMLPFLGEQYGNPSSIHGFGRKLRVAIEQARKTIADIMGCAPSEITFTSGGTEADNLALCSLVYAEPKVSHFISSPIEHHAVLHTLQVLEKRNGVKVTWLEVSSTGEWSIEQLEEVLKQHRQKNLAYTAAVSLMHANNEIGTVIDLVRVGQLCSQYECYFHSDTVQTVGHYPFSLSQTPVDFIVASAHKFYGPKGAGFLYHKNPKKVQPIICGGSQERNLRAGTENVAGIVGMAKALEVTVAEQEQTKAHLQKLKNYFIQKLKILFPGILFNGKPESEDSLASILNVAFPINDPESMLTFTLDIEKIACSGGSACTSGAINNSHVLKAIGCTPERMANSIRFSFGKQNTLEEVDYVLSVLAKVVTPMVA